MPVIESSEQLVSLLGDVAFESNPLEALKAQGFTFSGQMAQVFDTPEMGERLSSPQRRALVRQLTAISAPKFKVGPLERIVLSLPGDHHDLTLGVKLDVASEILADAHRTHSIPHQVLLSNHLEQDSLNQLLSLLRSSFEDVPEQQGVKIGHINLTGPPTLSPLDGTAHVIVNQPFKLDLVRVVVTGPFFGDFHLQEITSIQGVFHFGLALEVKIEEEKLIFRLGPLSEQVNVDSPERLRIDVNSDSPLQPQGQDEVDALAILLESFGFQDLLESIEIRKAVSPAFDLPLGGGVPLLVQHADIRVVDSDAGGHIMAGVLIGKEPLPLPGLGDPEILQVDPFEGTEDNVFADSHLMLFRTIAKQALKSGEIQKLAEGAKGNAKIKDADVELKEDEICFFLKGTLVDECGAFGQNFVDVDFDGCTTIRLEGVRDGEIQFRITEELGLGDADKTDVAKCILLSFLDLQILKIAFQVFKGLITKLIGFLVDLIVESSSDISGVSNLFEPNIPIPETELLPRLTVLSASVDSLSLKFHANLELVEDDVNTYIYVLFNQISSFPPFLPRPVQDAVVELLDQDLPRPAGDDVRIPVDKQEIFAGDKILKIVTTEYEPPTIDELLGSDKTDFRGRARFVLKPQEVRTTMGTLVTTTSLEEYSEWRAARDQGGQGGSGRSSRYLFSSEGTGR